MAYTDSPRQSMHPATRTFLNRHLSVDFSNGA
jgi:hypothetical protein